jgi:hypothetical protein
MGSYNHQLKRLYRLDASERHGKEPGRRPSWERWPPNCCETCTGPWEPLENDPWVGRCRKSASVNYGHITDARFRCQDFQRKP